MLPELEFDAIKEAQIISTISDEDKDKIFDILKEQMEGKIREKYINAFPRYMSNRNFCWVSKTEDGSFVKRIQKLLYEFSSWSGSPKLELSNDILTKLGEISSKGVATKIYYDFTKTLSWKAGNFGDRDSCFWMSDRYYLREEMSHNNYFAFRLFGPLQKKSLSIDPAKNEYYGKFKGNSRVWVTKYAYGNRPEVYTMHNAYGANLETFALYFAQITGLEYKYVNLGSNIIYINRNEGVIFGPKEVLRLYPDDMSINISCKSNISLNGQKDKVESRVKKLTPRFQTLRGIFEEG